MFQKKEYIYSETMGVCRVDDVTNLAPKKGNAVAYYVLRSVYQKEKVAYIPVDHHSVELRELIAPEQAKAFMEEWNSMDEQDRENEQNMLQKGEAEFVLKQEELNASKKNERKKKGNTETVAT
nr:CarD family transcriptional regulator [Lachnospiraceae bacterium]